MIYSNLSPEKTSIRWKCTQYQRQNPCDGKLRLLQGPLDPATRSVSIQSTT
jgi:hypothetical protein